MSTKTFKIFLLLFAILFTAAVVYAAGGKEGQKAGGVTTIRYTRWAGTAEAKDFTTLVNTFMKSHPNIKIEAEFLPWGAYWDKLRTTVISGEAADVLSFGAAMSAPYVTKEALFDMTEIPGAKELLGQMQEGTKAAVLYQNKIYGMPVGVGVRAMIYNKALFDEAGVPYPSSTQPMTWEQFAEMCKKLIKKDAKGNMVQYPAHFHKTEMYEALIVQAGGQLMDNYTRPTKMLINSPEAIRGLQFMVDMIHQNIIPEFNADWSGPWGTPDSAVATGKVAIMQAGPWGFPPLDEAKINFGTAPLFMDKKRANRGYINFLAMSKDIPQEKIPAAWEFIKWMCGEGQIEFTKTGDLPANKNALEQAKKSAPRPNVYDAYFSDLPYTITGPMIPSDEISSLIETVISEMCQDRYGAAEAAKTLEKDGNTLIKKIFNK